MNPLKQNNLQGDQNGLPLQLRQNIQQVKGMMKTLQSGNPAQLVQQNPMLSQVMQMCNGNPQQFFMNMCRQRGIDPQLILNELQN